MVRLITPRWDNNIFLDSQVFPLKIKLLDKSSLLKATNAAFLFLFFNSSLETFNLSSVVG